MAKYQKMLDETENVTSPNRGFRTKNQSDATYEQTKKGLTYFQSIRIVEADGIHALPLQVQILSIRSICSNFHSPINVSQQLFNVFT